MFAVAESETSSVNELHLSILFILILFIRALETAKASIATIDGEHSVTANQILIEHLHPLIVVRVVYIVIAPWMGQLHIQQHLLYLFINYVCLHPSHRLRHSTHIWTSSLHLLGQVVNNLFIAFEDKKFQEILI